MKIDSHQHFWSYDPEEYAWIGDDMAQLRRDFLPPELKQNIRECGIDGAITVQARQTLRETDWLLELAETHDFIKGVVGWLPLADCRPEMLEHYAAIPELKSVRHVIQDEADDDFILREDFNNGVALLKDYDLTYDILIFERHLPQTTRFVDRHPEQRFVLDHIAKPLIRDNKPEPWQTHIRELAKRENVWCKLSGMVTEADFRSWNYEQVKPYMETVLELFSAKRLMFGSDWPVCLAATGYRQWYELVMKFIGTLSVDEQARIMGLNALEAYKL
jgi:L-fuconolactonase